MQNQHRVAYKNAKAMFRKRLGLHEAVQRDLLFRELDVASHDTSKLFRLIRKANGQLTESTN